MRLNSIRVAYERLLECIAVALLAALALIVIIGVIFRFSGHALSWYDEVASVMLAWLTYYGAALAAIKRAHITIPSLVRALPRSLRLATALLGEAFVFLFLILLAWYGWVVLGLLQGETLVTVNIPTTVTQSTIPIGAALFIIAELMVLPAAIREALAEPEAATTPSIAEMTQ